MMKPIDGNNKQMTLLFILFVIMLVSTSGCITNNTNEDEKSYSTLSDCEPLGGIEQEECYAHVANLIALTDGKEGVAICDKIETSIIKDACYSEIVMTKLDSMPSDELVEICEKINNEELSWTCQRKIKRPHLNRLI